MTITRNANGTMRFSVSYSARMLTDVNGIIADVREAMKGVKYDTIVGRGTSGMLIVPIVARALRKNYFIIRKDEEMRVSHSAGTPFMGTLGKRWLFLDDFCSSGQTFRVVRDAVKEAVEQVNAMRRYVAVPGERDIYGLPKSVEVAYDTKFESELVGFYEYNSGMASSGSGFTPWNESESLSRGGYWSDCPYDVRQAEIREANRKAYIEATAARAVPGTVTLNGDSLVVGTVETQDYSTCTAGLPGCNCKGIGQPKVSREKVKVF